MMLFTVGPGFSAILTGSLGMVVDPPHFEAQHVISAITPFILLHAFANGTTALTGVEAISNGITAFKEPRSKNAGITLIWMSLILGSLFLGLSFLTGKVHGGIFSKSETVISQLARTIYDGRGTLYLMLIAGTTVILIMAANTAFADFPRLGALACRRWISSPPAYLSWKPPGLFARYCVAGGHCIHHNYYFSGKCDAAYPALCNRCISFLYTFTRRHGTSLVEDR